jgi:predicted AlkP superfamily phosphohydrolase/phosphomutase
LGHMKLIMGGIILKKVSKSLNLKLVNVLNIIIRYMDLSLPGDTGHDDTIQ